MAHGSEQLHRLLPTENSREISGVMLAPAPLHIFFGSREQAVTETSITPEP